MITPDQFQVNETWIAIRVNERFLFVQNEPYDIYLLLDAASCYVFGHAISSVVAEKPEARDVKKLFQTAFQTKNQWAENLILTGNTPADDVFRMVAEQNGLSVQIKDKSDLEPIIGPLEESFAASFMRGST